MEDYVRHYNFPKNLLVYANLASLLFCSLFFGFTLLTLKKMAVSKIDEGRRPRRTLFREKRKKKNRKC
jgi:hypothetical protein